MQTSKTCAMMGSDTDIPTWSLLAPAEPPAVEIVNVEGTSSAVLVCDHASNRIPNRLGTLGLDPRQLEDHVGWDPGAADVARRLSAHLDAPLVLSGYSRLVIDCNRPLCSKESIAEHSAGVLVPGNRGLKSEQRRTRIDALFHPYHRAIAQLLHSRSDRPNALLSLHSFTPLLYGKRRPWHIGVSSWRDHRFGALIRKALSRHRSLVVGDNEPYPIDDNIDYTIPIHSEGHGLNSVMIEMRQDRIHTEAGTAVYALRLAEAYLMIEANLR